ncbi:hypothetical protein [Actinophytocola sp. NPDC049390]|uniref:hypothetical protein n=1 Tax=Actinophytocola sp. NPDC049390 TaxID=3363894 RepID=UPI0037B29FA3
MSGDSYALVDLEVLGDDDTLREQAEAAREAAGDEPSDTYRADDPTRSIEVTVDRDGRLADLRLAEWWSDRLDPERFAETLFAVYTAAVGKALVMALSTRDDERDGPAPGKPEQSLAWINATLAENDAKLLAMRRAEPPADDEFALRSEHGYVTLHVRGGIATGLTANAAVLGYAKADVLRADVLAVFTDAGLTTED